MTKPGKRNPSIPMVAGRKQSLPCVYGDTPTFLGVPFIGDPRQFKDYDVIVLGVPWEGTITWGSYSGCELSPKTVRHAAARYGGYLPEIDIDLFDHLRVADAGDVIVSPGDEHATMLAIQKKISAITSAGAVPFCIGGDHSFSPAIVRAIGRSSKGKIGVVHFDSHFDNAERFNEDTYPRCSPLHHIAHLPQIKKTSIVHVGIRGPRNSKRQMQYARELGASVLTIQDIRRDGMDKTMDKAIFTAGDGTDGLYVTVCSDIIDVAFNPGGPPDFDGLTPHELFYAVRRLGAHGIIGFDFVEIYPLQDKNNVSAHLAAWSMIHALAGMAMRKRDSQRSKLP